MDGSPAGPSRGVLLVNLGSPDAPTPEAVRRYLSEFLSDPRVVDWPRWLWRPLLERVILPRRAPRSAELYRRVWTDAGAPLVTISRRQASALQARLGSGWEVAVGMRYGNPSLADGLAQLTARGCGPIVVLPMFPQSAEATTGSVAAEVQRVAAASEHGTPLALVPPFPTDAGYIDALAASVRECAAAEPPDHYVFSFHGLPARVVRRGDVYRSHCEATAAALVDRLALPADRWTLVFQSRFGPERWLQPYADRTVRVLAATHRRLLVATPGFLADCLETVDEIGRELARTFREAGGESLRRVPCLDDRPDAIDALARLVRAALPA